MSEEIWTTKDEAAYRHLRRKFSPRLLTNRLLRKCQHCQTLTIQEKHEDSFFCLKCESITE